MGHQAGCIFRKTVVRKAMKGGEPIEKRVAVGPWYLRYRDSFVVDGKLVRKQKAVKLADYCDRYRTERDLRDLAEEKMAAVRRSAACPHAPDAFISYVEDVYLPFVQRTMKPSTHAGYRTYWQRYIKPRVGKHTLRDFTVAIVSSLLEDIAAAHSLNTETAGKVRSILSGVFTYAMGKGHFPGTSASDNPASRALIPESAVEPKETLAASWEQVRAILAALKEMPLERAAVALMAFTGVRPGEARGLRWEEWDRLGEQIAVKRSIWRAIEGTTKTPQSNRFVAVTQELREILLVLWKVQGSPLGGYILAGQKGQPINLDNLAKRGIRSALTKAGIAWPGWYSLRRFHGTQVRTESNLDTTAKALGNSRAVADKHYIKPDAVLPDVRRAVNGAFSGLVQ